MDSQVIQEMLDNLDLQLAAGKIDLDTYQALTAKWQSKLQEIRRGAMPGSSAAGAGPEAINQAAAQAAAQAIAQIACPECSAPLEDLEASPGSTVRCSFCRATFTLKHAQEQTDRASMELKRWLEQMVIESGSSGAVDSASRRFIFNEKLYPALQLEYRRGMEPYEDVMEHPMVYLDLLEPLNGYQPAEHVLARNPEAVPGVRALSLRVNSPLVSNFAIGDQDRRKLRDLDLGTTNLVHLANVANLLAQPGPEAYTSAKENLMALSQEYDDYLSMTLEPGHKEYIQALRTRIGANTRVLSVLATIIAPGAAFAPQVYLEEMEAARSELQRAQELAERSAYNPLAVLPLKTGIDRDRKILQVVSTLLQSYRTASRNRSHSFPAYYNDLKALLAIMQPRPGDADQVIRAISQIDAIVESHRGEAALHRVDDWSWCEKKVNAGRARSLFGSENVHGQYHYWHPFWYATIRYAAAKGRFFVSGVEKAGYALLDAVARSAKPAILLDSAPRYHMVSQALAQKRAGDGKAILPSLVPRATAERSISQAAGVMEDLRNVKVTVEGLIYLPAVIVQYQSKSEIRTALYVCGEACDENQIAHRLLSDIYPFFERYV